MYSPDSHLVKVILYLLLLVVVFALIADRFQSWKNRKERWLALNLDHFPKIYRILLTECGEYMTEEGVQRYLKSMTQSYGDACFLFRSGQLARASKRYEYVQRCFPKVRERVARLSACAEAIAILMEPGDARYDEVESSNALIERRRRAKH